MSDRTRILVTGGAGYLGAVLVPKLLSAGHAVTVLDTLYFGEAPLAPVADAPHLTIVKGDIRDQALVREVLGRGFDVVIHLAAISNDPCSDLDESLTTAVNRDAMEDVMRTAKATGVRRFIYASSASVYGLKDTPDVTEDMSLDPLTIYARYKVEGERILDELQDDDFEVVSVRAATVCGYSPRLRLDLTINILTHHALTRGKIRVFGGSQMRPNVHIEDLTDLYVRLVDAPKDKIQGQRFNVSRENHSVMARMIKAQLERTPTPGFHPHAGEELEIEVVPSEDLRSYCLTAAKIERELGWKAERTLDDAVEGLRRAYAEGRVPDPDDVIYRNVQLMQREMGVWTGKGGET